MPERVFRLYHRIALAFVAGFLAAALWCWRTWGYQYLAAAVCVIVIDFCFDRWYTDQLPDEEAWVPAA